MCDFKIGDKVVYESGSPFLFEVDFHRHSKKVVIRRYKKGINYANYCKPLSKIRIAKDDEILANRRID